MSKIDAEKLEEALARTNAAEGYMNEGQRLIVAAASAHLATLPRFRTVLITQLAVIDDTGFVCAVYGTDHRAAAEAHVEESRSGLQIVCLTGIAKVKVTP